MKKTIRNPLWKKLKNSRGETIAETLVSLLILALAMIMLAGSIVSAARINKRVEENQTAFTTSNVQSMDGKVKITGAEKTIPVTIHITQDENKYVYYEK